MFLPLAKWVMRIVQVTTDCTPQQLLEYLQGEAATAASRAAVNQDRAKVEEERLLEAARMALGVQHIIRICSRNDQPTVTEPLQRLIQHGPAVRQAVDLSGLHICPCPFCYLIAGWSYFLAEANQIGNTCSFHVAPLQHVIASAFLTEMISLRSNLLVLS